MNPGGYMSSEGCRWNSKMNDAREEGAKAIMRQIHDVLWRDWDPLGVNDYAPDDEYDSYIGGVYRLLASGAGREALVQHLAAIEGDAMAIGPAPEQKLQTVADKLLALDVSMKAK